MVQHFIKEACERFSAPRKTALTPRRCARASRLPWKGNARSLKAAIEQAMILSSGVEITPEDLFGGSSEPGERSRGAARPRASGITRRRQTTAANRRLTFREAKEKFVGDWERDFFIRALRATGGNISRAAERTGMYRQSFQQKMRELGITLADIGLAPKSDAN